MNGNFDKAKLFYEEMCSKDDSEFFPHVSLCFAAYKDRPDSVDYIFRNFSASLEGAKLIAESFGLYEAEILLQNKIEEEERERFAREPLEDMRALREEIEMNLSKRPSKFLSTAQSIFDAFDNDDENDLIVDLSEKPDAACRVESVETPKSRGFAMLKKDQVR